MARISADLIKKVRQLEITTRRLLNGSLMGDSRSALKGSGFEFDQIRDYQQGDDIRCIDWRASARSDKFLVKQYREERNRTIFLAVDVSASSGFSSSGTLRSEVMSQVAAVLALVGDQGKDSVSLLLFSDRVEHFIPPARGRTHARAILTALFSHQAKSKKTMIAVALDYLMKLGSREGIVFLISDYIDLMPVERSLRIATRKYDIVAIRCLDAHERIFPTVGFVTIEDSETGMSAVLDVRGRSVRSINTFLDRRGDEQKKIFARYGIDCVDIALNRPFIGDMIQFFCRRMMY
jgi:uncharacterized protein (DUF58 family)